MSIETPQPTAPEDNESAETAEEGEIRSIRYFPVTMLAGILSFFGTGLAWEIAAPAFGLPILVAKIFIGFGLGYALAVIGLYVARQTRHPSSLREDLCHPRRGNFLAAAPLGLLMIIEAFASHFDKIADSIWLIACLATMVICAMILNQWLSRRFRPEEVSPAWFLPSSGLLIIPITGAPLGYPDISWMFAAAGILLWLGLFPITLNRLLFCRALSPVLMPDLFLLIVPPTLASIAITRLNGGYMDDMAIAFLGFALLVFVFFLPRLRRFKDVPFGMPWWCCSLSLGFLATACMYYFDHTGYLAAGILAGAMLLISTAATVAITLLSLSAFARGKMFRGPKS
ncbi:SLAC1 family transporter [Aestuariispira ectoiniformans]|uniref:SLAC1 family transporter n=1 Tax=Aestuariispira ectoiniformans TaxID=2775080 RepID=UPI00223BCA38|nr:hypothetical protein [Aestuariispira ectoiniformans]